ncbi:hypothetical protein C1631_022980 [Chryseobacterium phosphatilyticum]|uniref:Uncharacterized protein n=1 Tax=Chryseobacterium phosphatilyticum TaxID=475075 RepID=A0A316WLV9_9FLAO|nr:hypothetical protein [Chryseobacterium phosphatilyticum]PWN62432.1 hypothetical protein C1631_022980 [Chryseobacterium phosphatilyticum]
MDNKKYIRGSKDSKLKKAVLFKLYKKQIDFMSLFVKFKHEQGYDKLAYTRTDIMYEALQDFMLKNEKEFFNHASQKLQNEAEKLSIFNSKL